MERTTRPADRVAWDDEAQPGFFWDFADPACPLAEGGEVRVEPGQALIVHRDGAITDVVGPGRHRVDPATLPGLARSARWRGGTVHARLTFVSTVPSPAWRWGTADPVPVRLEGHGEVPVRAFGRFVVRIADPAAAFLRFARQGAPDAAEFRRRVRRIVAGRFARELQDAAPGLGDELPGLLAEPPRLGERLIEAMAARLAAGGLELRRFDLESVTLPLEVDRRIRPRTGPLARVTGTGPRIAPAVTPDRLVPCADCLSPVPARARFCPKCGRPRDRACTACGETIPRAAAFCPQCGARG